MLPPVVGACRATQVVDVAAMKLRDWTPERIALVRTSMALASLAVAVEALREVHETGDVIASEIARRALDTEVGS